MKEEVFKNFNDQRDRHLAARILDQGRQAYDGQAVLLTVFLDPHQQKVAETALRALPTVTHYSSGGYAGAERVRLALMPGHFREDEPDMGLRFVRLTGRLQEEGMGHRDVLGALLALGIKREGLGDILMDGEGAVVIATAEAAACILATLTRVGQLEVSVDLVEPRYFCPPPSRTREIKGTVASLRLDAVASLGYSVSRTRMVSVIKADQVKVNWQPVKNPAAPVKEGDVISIFGRGRLQVVKVGGESRKGRTHLIVKKYL